MKKKYKLIWTIFVLISLIAIGMYVYIYFNGGDIKSETINFIKKEGMITLITGLFFTLIYIIIKKLFKI